MGLATTPGRRVDYDLAAGKSGLAFLSIRLSFTPVFLAGRFSYPHIIFFKAIAAIKSSDWISRKKNLKY